jgi:hypothetical protein
MRKLDFGNIDLRILKPKLCMNHELFRKEENSPGSISVQLSLYTVIKNGGIIFIYFSKNNISQLYKNILTL